LSGAAFSLSAVKAVNFRGTNIQRLLPAFVFRMFLRNLYPEHAARADEINNEWLRKADPLHLLFEAARKVYDIIARAVREGDIQVLDDDVGLIDVMECRRGELDLFGDVDYDAGIFIRSWNAGGILRIVESRSRREYLHIRFGRAGVVKVFEMELAKKRVQPQLQAEFAEITATETSPAPSSPAPVPPKPQQRRGSRGPAPGTVDRYAKGDRKLFPAMKRLIKDGKKTVTAAAKELVHELEGIGSDDSKIARLANRFRKECVKKRN
jgi:hypothetical protein